MRWGGSAEIHWLQAVICLTQLASFNPIILSCGYCEFLDLPTHDPKEECHLTKEDSKTLFWTPIYARVMDLYAPCSFPLLISLHQVPHPLHWPTYSFFIFVLISNCILHWCNIIMICVSGFLNSQVSCFPLSVFTMEGLETCLKMKAGNLNWKAPLCRETLNSYYGKIRGNGYHVGGKVWTFPVA